MHMYMYLYRQLIFDRYVQRPIPTTFQNFFHLLAVNSFHYVHVHKSTLCVCGYLHSVFVWWPSPRPSPTCTQHMTFPVHSVRQTDVKLLAL